MKIPLNISNNAQLIEGIGASSWFTIVKAKNLYRIERFSIAGELECSGLFQVKPSNFQINEKYKFAYISHCKSCTIIQNNQTFKFFKSED